MFYLSNSNKISINAELCQRQDFPRGLSTPGTTPVTPTRRPGISDPANDKNDFTSVDRSLDRMVAGRWSILGIFESTKLGPASSFRRVGCRQH